MDRKARIREYKETPQLMGVCRVRNTANGKWLLRSSVNVPGMINRTRFQLENGSHKNHALQKEWDDLGPEAFEFDTLDTLEPADAPGHDPAEDLRMLAEMWFERLTSSEGRGYDSKSERGS